MNQNYCKFCHKEIPINRKFCSVNCQNKLKHQEAYRQYLNNNQEYCRGNYTPKNFYEFFLEEQNYECAICHAKPIHNNQTLRFVIDHIDGDASNNKRENIRLVCPNCDSQLPTFKSKNKNSTRRNYWREKILRQKIIK